jgi:alkyl sulfatase BDS1-like metallo-beta-lactamase superfamily hydrolase
MELRHGSPTRSAGVSPELLAGMSVEMIVDYMAIRLNGPRAADTRLHIGLDIVDGPTEQQLRLVVDNGVLRHEPPSTNPAGTLRTTRQALSALAYGTATLDDLLSAGAATVHGDRTDLDTLLGLLDTFAGTFDIVTPNLR